MQMKSDRRAWNPIMSHLSTERLAALVDEAPSAAELSHLAGCALCARERSAYQRLGALASLEASRIGVPLTTWERLAPALRHERHLVDYRERVSPLSARAWLRAAAAVTLFVGGAAVGRLSGVLRSPSDAGKATSTVSSF